MSVRTLDPKNTEGVNFQRPKNMPKPSTSDVYCECTLTLPSPPQATLCMYNNFLTSLFCKI